MKVYLLLVLFAALFHTVKAQKYMTRTGYIGFFSHTAVEDIQADNNQVASVLDASNGDVVFQVLMKSFHFDKLLMEEHFNENYVESDRYPKATFAGSIKDISEVDFKKPGEYKVIVEGDLNIHGVTKKISEEGLLIVGENTLAAQSKFMLDPEDFNIKIPSVVRENIANQIEVTVKINYDPAK